MRIDWVTFAAQVVNFLVLVWLLHRFLYRPVLEALDRREERIASRLEEAARERERAEARSLELEAEREALERKRARLIREAEEAAEARRGQLQQEIRAEADQVREAWRESLRRQREDFVRVLRDRMSRELYRGIRGALADLADQELEERVVAVFVERLGDLPEAERAALARAVGESGGRARVRSAFPLDDRRRDDMEEALARVLSDVEVVEVTFHQEPDLALGIEVLAGDRRVGWSADSYLEELEAATLDALDAEVG